MPGLRIWSSLSCDPSGFILMAESSTMRDVCVSTPVVSRSKKISGLCKSNGAPRCKAGNGWFIVSKAKIGMLLRRVRERYAQCS